MRTTFRFFFSSRRRHTRLQGDWSSDVCSSDLSIAQGLVAVSQVEKEITEEYLGTYRVPELILDIGAETVRFSPKGRNTIGANGRVDLVGELDAMTLVLEPAGHWSVVLSRLPRQLVALDGKALTEALRRVMR